MHPLRRLAMNSFVAFVLPFFVVASASAQGLVAAYLFENNLNAVQANAPSVTPIDPLGLNQFMTATVFGQSRSVYFMNGNTTVGEQAGFSLKSANLIAADHYSLEAVFEFRENANQYRRILSVQDTDSGLYVDPSDHLTVYPAAGQSSKIFQLNTFYHVVLTVSPSDQVQAYVNGNLEFTSTTPVMEITNPDTLMTFFVDSVGVSFPTEFGDSRIALLRLYEGLLPAADILARADDPFNPVFVSEPSSWRFMAMAAIAFVMPRLIRKAQRASDSHFDRGT